MCTDCEFHRNMLRDASLHAVGDLSVELGTGKAKVAKPKKPVVWRKFAEVKVGTGADEGDAIDTSFLTIKPEYQK